MISAYWVFRGFRFDLFLEDAGTLFSLRPKRQTVAKSFKGSLVKEGKIPEPL